MSIALLLLAVQAASPVTIAPPSAIRLTPEFEDTRCLAAFGFLASRNGREADVIGVGAMYFYGKLMGRNPSFDLTKSLRAAVVTNPTDLQTEVRRCSQELKTAGGAMTAAGAALMKSATP